MIDCKAVFPILTIFMYATLSRETINNFLEIDDILAKNDAIIAKMNERQKNYDDQEIKNYQNLKNNFKEVENILEERENSLEERENILDKKEEILKNKELSLLVREQNLRAEKESLIQDFCDGVKENFHISDLDNHPTNCWDSCSIL